MVNLLRGGTPPSPPTPKSSLVGVPRSLVGMGDIAIQPVFSLLAPLDVKIIRINRPEFPHSDSQNLVGSKTD